MKKLSDLFEIAYGNKFDLNKMTLRPAKSGGINFVGRSSKNHGVTAAVAPFQDATPNEAGLITVALGGTKLLSAFVQEQAFYTAQNVAILTPIQPLKHLEKLFLCMCIRHSRFRYSAFGREANRTLRDLIVPEPSDFPAWVYKQRDAALCAQDPTSLQRIPLKEPVSWKLFRYDELFTVKKGYYNKKPPTSKTFCSTDVPFVGASHSNNGVTSFIAVEDVKRYSRDGKIKPTEDISRKMFPAGGISVPNNGASVAEASYQATPFTCTHDVNPIYLKDSNVRLTPGLGIFLATVIRADKYRWNYGRKWRPARMPSSTIKLPVTSAGTPDWTYMETFVRSLSLGSLLST